MTKTRNQSLAGGVRLFHAGRLGAAHRCGLDGCPVGGWPETEQAIRRLADELPAARSYSTSALIDAVYLVDHAGRYRTRTEDKR
jgi:hypothetical protein